MVWAWDLLNVHLLLNSLMFWLLLQLKQDIRVKLKFDNDVRPISIQVNFNLNVSMIIHIAIYIFYSAILHFVLHF